MGVQKETKAEGKGIPKEIQEWLEVNPTEATLLINDYVRRKHKMDLGEYAKTITESLNFQSIPSLDDIESNPSLDNIYIHKISSYAENESELFARISQMALYFTKAERCALFFIDDADNCVFSTAYDFEIKAKVSNLGNSLNIASLERKKLLDHGLTRSPSSNCSLNTSTISRLIRKEPFKCDMRDSFFEKVLLSECLNIENLSENPEAKKILDESLAYDSKNCVALPILDGTQKPTGIAVFVNKKIHNKIIPFSEADETTLAKLTNLLGLVSSGSMVFEMLKAKEKYATDLALRNARLFERANLEAKKNKMLLDLTSSMFSEDDIRELGRKIVSFARELINADKASVFLSSEDKKELISAVFDTNTKSEHRISSLKGIAGYVFTKGELVNLTDVYSDERFSPEMDIITGYKTKSILCIPIPGPSRIVGVATLLNKLSPEGEVTSFNKTDESLFSTFVMMCGLSLHKTMLLDEIQKKQMQLEIHMDLMSYHTVAHIPNIDDFISTLPPKIDLPELSSFHYDCHIYESGDNHLCGIAFQMFEQMGFFEKYKISQQMCMQYILTIRKNYRNVAYHNFTHAVSVTHNVYLMFTQTQLKDKYTDTEKFCMFLAALNHDIDHRGTNNQFQKTAHTVLANYYSTSTMERHHFNYAVNILRSPGHNMFHSFDNDEYKHCLKSLEKSILATDLALYFANRNKLKTLLNENVLDYNDVTHSDLVRGIVMTTSDLTAMTKPWESSQKTADSVYSEFFFQGDEELKLGLPISANLMDRKNMPEIPSMQVGFFNAIVIPAFELMAATVPETEILSESVKQNLMKWKELLDEKVHYEFGLTIKK